MTTTPTQRSQNMTSTNDKHRRFWDVATYSMITIRTAQYRADKYAGLAEGFGGHPDAVDCIRLRDHYRRLVAANTEQGR
jgi:hypothetical protein